MKKLAAAVCALAPALVPAGCGKVPAPGSDGGSRPVSAYIQEDVTSAEVIHILMGREISHTADWDELNALRKRANGLRIQLF